MVLGVSETFQEFFGLSWVFQGGSDYFNYSEFSQVFYGDLRAILQGIHGTHMQLFETSRNPPCTLETLKPLKVHLKPLEPL